MAIIDKLVLSLGLDSSDFTKGANAATTSLNKAKEKLVKEGKEIEAQNKKVSESFNKVASDAMSLFAVFMGGKSFKDFTEQVTKSNVALGNQAANLQMSAQYLSAWGMAAQEVGGNADATKSSIQGLSDKLQALRQKGAALPIEFSVIAGKTGSPININQSNDDLLVDLAGRLAQIAKTEGRRSADSLARGLGLDPGTTNLMIENGGKIRETLERLRKFSASETDIAQAKKLNSAWTDLGAAFQLVGIKIVTALAPALEKFADALTPLILQISNWVEHVNPLWIDGIAALAAIWTGAKVLGMIANIIALKDALLGLGGVNAASSSTGLLGTLGRLFAVGALGYDAATNTVKPLNGGEDERRRQQGGRASLYDLRRRGKKQQSSDNTNYHDSDPFYDAIIQAEGTAKHGNPYDTSLGYLKSSKPLSEMTMNEALAWGDHIRKETAIGQQTNSSAKGAFQIVNTTQREAMSALGIKGNELFSPENQRRMASYIARKQGLGAWEGLKIHPNYMSQARAAMNNANPKSSPYGGLGNYNFPKVGAPAAASLSTMANDNRVSTSSNSNAMHIGTINVNAPHATDAGGIAKELGPAINMYSFANLGNYGAQ